MHWDWSIARDALPVMLKAFFEVTLVVTVVASILSALLGLIWAIGLREMPGALSKVLAFVLSLLRNTPIPLQLLIAAYAIVQPTGWLSHTSSLAQYQHRLIIIGIVVFALQYSTYMAESYRGGIESIRSGQWEAATALSLPRRRTWQAVIVPQAMRAALPSLGNWAIAMFKDTPYLIAISVPEMVSQAQDIGGNNFSYIEVMTIAGLIFLVASYPTAILMRTLEKKLVY
ncbi:amino acid ABC transporter permease [Leekyejoonella antrihumi]|uniref:ABC transporter permease subunit n=1 Tax=Leekyejoonella antrihumi TaxID=1660198 RepID=A0A563E9Y4_9MICO|nr:ABC transporter permease subunit [Leekyejoonella antrihumi]TWP39021.1 ABC transporter permease subunit [Leekyejoonella antrihumi]